jgi:hypothetical protein
MLFVTAYAIIHTSDAIYMLEEGETNVIFKEYMGQVSRFKDVAKDPNGSTSRVAFWSNYRFR